eukprot:TRINITY_DN88131_c0_g1_i1.p1 TRINITY_DN88131_c0_g1~~TRINITY_DN88131_c0_g1_i1.p1  ORF type:complete len:879 (+),score=147.93 TRINITY_DN88131_c0_g1_i1:104-2740(+)
MSMSCCLQEGGQGCGADVPTIAEVIHANNEGLSEDQKGGIVIGEAAVRAEALSEDRIAGALVGWEDERVISLVQRVMQTRPWISATFQVDVMKDVVDLDEVIQMNTDSAYLNDAATVKFTSTEDDVLDEPKESPTIIQFGSAMFFCTNQEAHVSIDVKRMGNVSGRSEVCFTTKDATAKAGHNYMHTEGNLVFEPGERDKSIGVDLIKTKGWTGAMEFVVELLAVELTGATLGRYLYKARVKIIDSTCFPTNKYMQPIFEGRLDSVPKLPLLIEYWKFNWLNPVVRRGTWKMMLVEQVHNLYFMMNLFLNVYLIDYILDLTKSEDILLSSERRTELLLVVLIRLIPFALLHFLDYTKLTWKVGGASRMSLQRSMLRRYLNYTEESRSSLEHGDVIMAIARDAVTLAADGYAVLIPLSRSIGQLVVILLFQVTSPMVFNKTPRPLVYVPLGIFPFILLPFLFCRQKKSMHYESNKDRKETAIVERVNRTVANYRLIADYNTRPELVSWFEQVVAKYNVALVEAKQVMKNNEYYSPWITLVLVSIYTVLGGTQVAEGLSLGSFLTNVQIFNAVGKAYGSIYNILLQMQSSFNSLERIVRILNLPIDVPLRMELGRKRRELTKQLRDEILAGKPDYKAFALDLLPIKVHNMNFSFPGGGPLPGLSTGTLEIKQGTLVSLVGPHSEGKSTLLKILGEVILPPCGTCFVPSHLRVLHVGTDGPFCQGTLFKNVTFGISEGDPDAAPERVKEICRKIGMPDVLMACLDSDEVRPWPQVLSMTTRYMVSLARAFVFNPEVLCIHKPILSFDESIGQRVLGLLRNYVDARGIALDDSTAHLRRPRTCIMTSAKMSSVQAADQVYHISAKTGIRLIKKDEVDFGMIG